MGSDRPDQTLVAIAAAPAQLVVEMRHAEPPAVALRQPAEHFQQDHRVQPAGNRDEKRLPRSEKLPALDRGFDALNQVAHGIMLKAWAALARALAMGVELSPY